MIYKIPFLFLLASMSTELNAQNQTKTNYTVDDGLPSNTVYCVQQDDRGFMWFGTDAGLSRYDGYEFINYSLDDALPDTEILHFYKDSKKRIWLYTLNGKVGFIRNDSIFSSKNTEWLKKLDFKSRITSIVEVNEKIYLTGTETPYKILEGKEILEMELKGNRNKSFCFCNGQLTLLSSTSSHIVDLENGTVGSESTYNNVSEYIVLTYPICFGKKIYALNLNYAFKNFLYNLTEKSISKTPTESRILNIEMHNDQLFILTNSGITHLDVEEKTNTLFASIQFATSMLIDNEGNNWITSLKSGIHFKSETRISFDQHLRRIDAISNIDGSLYLAHDENMISRRDENGKNHKYITFNNANTTKSIVKDAKGQILIGRYSGTFLNNNKIAYNKSNTMTLIDTTILIGSRDKIRKIHEPAQTPNILSGNVWDILAINKDSILLGTDNGLLVINLDSIHTLSAYRLFSNEPEFKTRVNKLIHDQSKISIATAGNGIIQYFKRDSFLTLSTNEGLISNVIDDMILKDSILWTVTPKGINRIYDDNIQIIDGSDGLSSYLINDIESFNDSIYLATDNGLFSFSSKIDLLEKNRFTFFITNVLIDNMETFETDFRYNINSVQIEYKALLYRNHRSLSYQYQLLTNENAIDKKKWIDTDFNQVNFLGLNPNKYTFWVRARTKNSEWSQPISYQFNIKPALWQTTWFQISLIALFVGGIIIYVNKVNERRLNKKNLEKAKINAELTALKAQINPHFLFNVLNSIQSFILENEKDIAQKYLVKYGRLMRMVLDHSDRLLVSLESEIEMLNLYTDLEKLRLKNGFDFEIIQSEYFHSNNIQIPSMVIQPFVENAIWHGLSPLRKKGKITIEIDHIHDHLQILVADNGVGFTQHSSKSSDHNSSGVRLVRDRLKLLKSPDLFKNYVEIESEKGKGTKVIISFSDSLTS